MTEMLKAAGRPLPQCGRKTLAGQFWQPGIKEGNSFCGAKAAG